MRLVAGVFAILLVKADRGQFAGRFKVQCHKGLDFIDVDARWRTSAHAAANLTSDADADRTAHFGSSFGSRGSNGLARAGGLANIVDAVEKASA